MNNGTQAFSRRNPGKFLLLISLTLTALASSTAWGQVSSMGCGALNNHYGPFDYRPDKYKAAPGDNEPHAHKLFLVHSAHFRPEMEALVRGGQGEKSDVGPEFDYTLRAFPNHHRALIAMVKLAEKQKTDQPKGMRYTVECWFERALRFQPDDTLARLIYTSYLIKKNRANDALAQLEVAERTAEDNPFTHYNIGLLYNELKSYDKALLAAHRAYGGGIALPELRNRLEAAGKWQDAPTESAATKGSGESSNPNTDNKAAP